MARATHNCCPELKKNMEAVVTYANGLLAKSIMANKSGPLFIVKLLINKYCIPRIKEDTKEGTIIWPSNNVILREGDDLSKSFVSRKIMDTARWLV